jgi:gliding motility-associated-like protein
MKKFYLAGLALLMVLGFQTQAQNGFSFSCTKDTTINGCASTCITLKGKIPNLHSSTTDYDINPLSGPGGCYVPYVSASTPGNPVSLTIDDKYSAVITLPFSFPFYDDAASPYNSLIASTNGYLSFDISEANNYSHWSQAPGNVPNVGYDRSLIMGVFHDLDPGPLVGTSPTQQIKYDIIGTAPHRRFILSFYKVPLFSAACNPLIENTHQIVLYESTGIIEVFVKDIQQCAGWNQGRKMIGLQNFNENKGLMAPGRTSTGPAWGSVGLNESWRFVPAVGPTLYRGVELYNLAGTLISTGDTTSINNSTFEVSFPNVCPAGNTTYIIRSRYEQINNPGNFVFGSDTVNVISTNPLTAVPTVTPATCATQGLGTVTVAVTGGSGNYEYSSDGGTTWQASNLFTLAPGTYTINYREVGSSCIGSLSVTITSDPNLLNGTYVITNVACNGGNTGAINITAINGTGGYEYSINGGTNYQTSGNFPNLVANTYSIRIRDAAGCFRDTTITITEPTALVTSAVTSNASCSPIANGSIFVTASGGTPNYEYSINGTTFQASPSFTVFDGTYTVTIRDNNGCVSVLNNQVVGLINDLVVDTRVDTTLCFGASVTLTTTGNAATYDWSTSTGSGLSSTSVASPIATPTVLGNNDYTVVATLGQCTATDQVRIITDAQVIVTTGPDVSVLFGDQVQLVATVTGATSFQWTSTPVDPVFNSTILNPIVKPTVTTTYLLTATNSIGCSASGDIKVTVIPVCIEVNNAFTPNGDGINDRWSIYRQYDCLSKVRLTVFNRYGAKVFESVDYRNDWDGTYKGKPVPDGTYYAVIDFSLISGKKVTTKTDLTIIR